MTATPLRIVELRADSVKRLRAIQIRPDEHGQVVLAGGNGEGKSSVLDAIAMALGGRDQIPAEPIRRGAERAEVVLDLGEIIVRRTFTPTGPSQLVVQSREGAKFSSPQSMLDNLTGRLSFDPLAFSRDKPARQSEILQELLGLDLAPLDRKREQAFEERTVVNRRAKALQSRLDAMPEHADAPDDPVSVADLSEQMQAANSTNSTNAAVRKSAKEAPSIVEDRQQLAKKTRKRIEDLQAELAEQEMWVAVAVERAASLAKQAESLVDIDTAPLLQQIRTAEDTNRRVREKHERRNLAVEQVAEVAKSETLTKRIADVDNEKAAAIASAPMPVPNLGFDESGGVTLNGLPLDQASAAEKLRVSVAIGIAMNPRLRVLLIRDAALLDDKSMRMVADLARSADCQLWVERIGVDEHTTVVIEDGEATAVRSEAL